MARAHFRWIADDRAGNVVQNAAVYLFAVGTGVPGPSPTGTAITGSMYALRELGSAIANPLISNDRGIVEAWLDTPQTVDVVVTRNGDQAHYPGNSQYKVLFEPFKEVGHAYHDPADVGGGGGGGAPTDALYVVTGANATLTAEKILGTDVIIRGAAASKPATPAFDGQLYIETDGSRIVWRGNGTTSWDEIARGEVGIRLAQLAEKAHGSLTGVTADQHHPQTHTHGSHTGIGPDDHHTRLHSIIGASDHNGFPGGTTLFLRADGTFAAPPGGGGGAPTDAQYLVLVANGTLTDERVLTPGIGLDITDGGAGGAATLDIDSSEFPAEAQLQMFDDTLLVRDVSAGAERKVAPVNLDNPRNGFKFANDLLFLNALTGGENVGEFEVALSGTGAGFALGPGDQSHPGIQTASTGTTAAGGALIGMSGNALRLGGGKARMAVCLKTGPNLSAAAQRYDIQAGFWDNGFADATDGVYLRYSDDINAGKWQLIAVSNGVSTVVDTGVTVTADTWYTLEVEVNADGSSAEAFINGASVGTVATNIPTAVGRETGGGVQIWKSVGTTARTMDIDMVRLALDFTTAR